MNAETLTRWLLASATILMLVFLALWQFESWRASMYRRLTVGRGDQIERYSLVLMALLEYLERIGPELASKTYNESSWCPGCGTGAHTWAHIEHTDECLLICAERLADFARDQLGEVAVIILKGDDDGPGNTGTHPANADGN